MTQTPDPRQLERLKAQLGTLRDGALKLEESYLQELARIDPGHRASAQNLLHYLSVRQHDIRILQEELSALGLSSLGVLEPHALASLNAVIGILEGLTGTASGEQPEAPVDFQTGPQRLRDHTRFLLGPDPRGRFVRIMVTMPSEAATDPKLVQDLLGAGMDVMRINCAHDGPAEWSAMVENLRQAERALGRSCRVQADLAGPKLRTGPIRPIGRVLRLAPRRDAFGRTLTPARVLLVAAEPGDPSASAPASTLAIAGDLLPGLEPGDVLRLMDTRGQAQEVRVREAPAGAWIGEIDRTAYVEEGTAVVATRAGQPLAEGRIVKVPEVVRPIALAPGDRLILTRRARFRRSGDRAGPHPLHPRGGLQPGGAGAAHLVR
jgi:pyruvate kinase